MGSPHKERSQASFHSAFRGYYALATNQISVLLAKLAEGIVDRPVRILDLGAGTVPYRAAFERSGMALEITLVDRDSVVKEAMPNATALQTDFFHLYDAAAGGYSASAERMELFDLVVLSATLHELYFDAVTVVRRPEDFHLHLLRFIRNELLGAEGFILIGDYAWPAYASADHIRHIREIQERKLGHADPPWTFIALPELQRIAAESGLQQRSFVGCGLFDELDDAALRNEFDNLLEAEELATARLRIGYVITLAADSRAAQKQEAVDTVRSAWPRRSSVYLGIAASAVIQNEVDAKVGLERKLNEIFTDRRRERLGCRSPLWHLNIAIRHLAQIYLEKFQIASPGTYETWFSVGIKALGGRFIPRLPNSGMGEAREASVLSFQGIESMDLSAENCDVVPGPVTEAYHKFLAGGKTSVHGWAHALHSKLRARIEQGGRLSDGARDIGPLRSITVMLARGNGASEAAPLALGWRWGTLAKQRESGHYLLTLGPLTGSAADDETLTRKLDDFLRHQVAPGVLGAEEDGPGLVSGGSWGGGGTETGVGPPAAEGTPEEQYSRFLRAAFSFDGQQPSWFAGLWRRLHEHDAGGSTPPLPFFNVYTTVIVGCDGLSETPPDSIMIFGEQAFPPELLDAITGIFSDLFRSLGRAEEVRKTKAEEQAKRLLIVAGASHAFKNLLMPLRGGLRDIDNPESPLKKAVDVYNRLKTQSNYVQKTLPENLARNGVIFHDDLLVSSLELAGSMGDYRNIVERLWGKIYSLHISTLSPEAIDIGKWCIETSFPYVIAGSFFCSWYAFLRDDLYLSLRQKKGVIGSTSEAKMQLSYTNEGSTSVASYRFGQVRAAADSSGVINSMHQVDELRNVNGSAIAMLPAILIEALTEECFLNAIKYGDMTRPIEVSCELATKERTTALSISIRNWIDPAVKGLHTGGRGRKFIELLVKTCGGELEESPSEDLWTTSISCLRWLATNGRETPS